MNHSVTLTIADSTLQLPIYAGTLGPAVIDVTSLGKNGMFTYDPGFISTAACASKITYIDGENGILLHHGYPIEQLAEQATFLEVGYLLLYGKQPDKLAMQNFRTAIAAHSNLDDPLPLLFNGFRRDAHPMAMMIGALSALAGLYHHTFDRGNLEHRNQEAIKLIAKMPILAAMCHRYSMGEPQVASMEQLGYAENFLYMLFNQTPNPVLARALDRILILHADHEQNASTSALRLVASTGANPYACIAAAITALWGPRHGGANEACLNMLTEIGDTSRVNQYIKRAKDPNDPFRLMGFGHRVYKNFDPRAVMMRHICHGVLEQVDNRQSKLFEVARSLEKIALEDEYFIERKLYPNVDFYSGIILNALGIPVTMFTVIFLLARTVGWLSHWMECLSDPNCRLSRPRQLYVGAKQRDYVTAVE